MDQRTLSFLVDLYKDLHTLGSDFERVMGGDFETLSANTEKIADFIHFSSYASKHLGDEMANEFDPPVPIVIIVRDAIGEFLWEYGEGCLTKQEAMKNINKHLEYKGENEL